MVDGWRLAVGSRVMRASERKRREREGGRERRIRDAGGREENGREKTCFYSFAHRANRRLLVCYKICFMR